MLCKTLHTWTQLPPTNNVPAGNSAAFLMSSRNTHRNTAHHKTEGPIDHSWWLHAALRWNMYWNHEIIAAYAGRGETTLSPTFQTPPRHWQMHYQMETSCQCQKKKEQNTACWYNLTTIISAISRIMKWVFWACIPYYVFLPVSTVPCRSWGKREDGIRTAGLHHKPLVRQEHSFISGRIIVTNHFLTPDFQEGSTKYLQKVNLSVKIPGRWWK